MLLRIDRQRFSEYGIGLHAKYSHLFRGLIFAVCNPFDCITIKFFSQKSMVWIFYWWSLIIQA